INQAIQALRGFEKDAKVSIAQETEYYKNIYLHINTYGGNTIESLVFYDFVRSLKSINVIGIVEGYCCSGGTILLLACNERKSYKNSVFLIHQLRGWHY